VSINLAALQDAAEALGEAVQATEEGRPGDAQFAITGEPESVVTP
jgi:hypothetical protein